MITTRPSVHTWDAEDEPVRQERRYNRPPLWLALWALAMYAAAVALTIGVVAITAIKIWELVCP